MRLKVFRVTFFLLFIFLSFGCRATLKLGQYLNEPESNMFYGFRYLPDRPCPVCQTNSVYVNSAMTGYYNKNKHIHYYECPSHKWAIIEDENKTEKQIKIIE